MYSFPAKVSDYMYNLILSLLIFLPGWTFIHSHIIRKASAVSMFSLALQLVMNLLRNPNLLVDHIVDPPIYLNGKQWRSGMASVLVG